MKGYQKAHLRGLGKHLQPAVNIGRNGLTSAVLAELTRALDQHELIKIRFTGGKEQKDELTAAIAAQAGAELAGTVGHTALFYRQHANPERRNIHLPARDESSTDGSAD